MAKKNSTTTKAKAQIEDTFQDLDVTLNDGLDVVEEIEESQEVEEIVEEPVKVEPVVKKETKPASKAAGIYYKGQLVEIVKSQGKTDWTVFVGGRKITAPAADFEVVE